jgi:5-methyltetrahydrofolate--homocysteine methyltransferase
MAQSFLEKLRAGEVLVADGATGTNYQRMGLKRGVPPEEWVMDEPQNVVALHRQFVEAGSDLILTCSFGGTRWRMRDSKYADCAPAVNRRAAQLAREAAGMREGVYVGGAMGPTGLWRKPFGELTHALAVETYAEQAAALTEGGVDFLLLETFFVLEEAIAAIEGVKQTSVLPLVVSCSYHQDRHTMMGLQPAHVFDALAPLGVVAIGANCGKTLDDMMAVAQEFHAQRMKTAPSLPLWIKPNAGLPRMIDDVATYEVTPAQMGAYAARFVQAGAQIVGGCCGNTPEHVRAIARAVKHGASR